MLGSPKPDPRYIPVYIVQYCTMYIIINLQNIFITPSLPPQGRKSGYGTECKNILSSPNINLTARL